MRICLNIIIVLQFIVSINCFAQLDWINYSNNDPNNSYFYNKRGISKNGNSILTSRGYFSPMFGSFYSNFTILDDNGNLIKDTSYNNSQFFGIYNIDNVSFGNGFVIGQLYNPQTLINSDVYEYITINGSPVTIVSDDSIGVMYDLKSRNDTLFCLKEEITLGIRLYDELGIDIGYIRVDSISANEVFRPTSFELAPLGIVVFGYKSFNGSSNSHFCIRYVDWQGNLIYQYLSNPSNSGDEVSTVCFSGNSLVFGGKIDVPSGVSNFVIGVLSSSGALLWDTTLTYQTLQRNILDLKEVSGQIYLGLIGRNTASNLYDARVINFDVNSLAMNVVLDIDSLVSKVDLKFDNYSNGIVVCGVQKVNLYRSYELYYLNQNSANHFFSFFDTTSSSLAYMLIDNLNLYFGGTTFLAKYDLTSVNIHENIFNSNLVVFPNPTSSLVYLNGDYAGYQYSLVNSIGCIVESSISVPEKLDLSRFSSGIYNLLIYNSKHRLNRKIVVSH